MRFCTWNMNRRSPARVWPIIEQRIDPDFAFVQEAQEPKHLAQERVIWRAIGTNSRYGEKGRYHWATGIYSKEKPLRQLTAGELGHGWIVVAETDTSEGTLTLISIHVEPPLVGFYTESLDRILSELTPLLEEEGRLIVLGGDLNVDVLLDEVKGTTHNRRVIDRIEGFGLFHCNSLLPDGTRTFLTSEQPYQDDHLFVSRALASRASCRVLDDGDMSQFSDHYPLILELQGGR